jgi:hypothetical protein
MTLKWGLYLAKDLEPGMLIPEHGPNGMWMRNKEIAAVSVEEIGKKYFHVRVMVVYANGDTAVYKPEDRVQVQGSMVR